MLKNQTWTGIKTDKNTGEALNFYIFRNDGVTTFEVEEARALFPTAVERLERSTLMYKIYS